MATPDTKHSIVIVKTISYRGTTRRFGNRYHFEGALPADPTAWTTLADNITAAEKAIYSSTVTIVEAIGYNASTATSTNPHGDSVFNKTYSLDGTQNYATAAHQCPGDCAALIRYSTLARSAKNHPVYLMNYYHGVWVATGAVDSLLPAQASDMTAYAAEWVTGFTDGSGARERCGPRGAGAVSGRVDPLIRHRDFPN